MKLFRTLLSILFLYVSCAAVVAFGANPDMFASAGVISGMIIFTAPGGVATPFSFNMTFLPEFIGWNDGGNPLTSLRIETQEDGVLHDFTAAGIAAMNGFMKVGAQAANEVLITLASGEIRPKNVTVSGVTSAAGAIAFSVCSDNTGIVAFKSSNAAILAANPTVFEKFTALFVPAAVTATDRFEVEFSDGHKQNFDIVDLQRLSSQYQQVQGTIVNNKDGYIKKVTVTCAAAHPAYILSVYIPGQ